MITWAEWKCTNADKIAHVAGYEGLFVDKVLSRVPLICPLDVVAQFEFIDDKKIKRRIDFMIINKEKGYLLPIELDGASKDHQQAAWSDFLDRQNALIRSFGVVLRYSNVKMLNSSDKVVQEISEVLLSQEAAKRSDALRRQALGKVNSIALPVQSLEPVSAARSTASPPSQTSSMGITVAICILLCCVFIIVYYTIKKSSSPIFAFSEPARVMGQDNFRVEQPAVEQPAVENSPGAQQISNEYLQASHAHEFVGQRRRVCGRIASTRDISAGRFINFERPYPNEVMSAVVWREYIDEVGRLNFIDGERLCIFGLIRTYNGKPRIEISRRDQILP